ncbi:uncharacterized protein LOC131958471 [Physella acuta]|uniref:uncharacterized protein LOC131958471 n=1 Tax=Physella acuta TaxID=109671 RepID=UPI0027DDD8CA|nr:uncharacterized protein LOC131958471 [Physella acuta]XP_059179520.1 uncharacterized protein LOC131958471 [Physella acuta]XP_059179521.1 uncharacterized protein LOC131958471 [Physella acuta]
MDGNMYNYAQNNIWSNYNESFQPPSLDLQSYMPTNREYLHRETNKNTFIPTAPPYVFFHYNGETGNPHYVPESINRNHWHQSAWSKIKSRPDLNLHHTSQQHEDQHFKRDLENRNLQSGPESINSVGRSPIKEAHIRGTTSGSQSNSANDIPTFSVEQSQPNSKIASKKNSKTPKKKKNQPKESETNNKKRTRDEEKWARNVRKKARARGESYVSVQGKVVPARCVKPVDCSKCKFNCPSRVSEEEREILFKEYWSLDTFKEKVNFISSCVHEFTPLRPVSGRRAYSRRYMLKNNGKEERVCKEFFVTTFDISESTIVTYMSKKRKGPEAIADMRGKQTPSNKTPQTTVRLIREHILAQIGLHGEFTRSPNDDMRNVKRLYKNYQSECEGDGIKPASISVYRKVFTEMHKDKTDSPVVLPPENILAHNPKRRAKTPKKHEGNHFMLGDDSAQSSISENESSPCESNSLPATNTPPLVDLDPLPKSFKVNQQIPASVDSFPDNRMGNLYLPHSTTNQHQFLPSHLQQSQQYNTACSNMKSVYNHSISQGVSTSSIHNRLHVNNMLPFMWDSDRPGTNVSSTDQGMISAYPGHSYLNQPAASSSLFNFSVSPTAPEPQLAASKSNSKLCSETHKPRKDRSISAKKPKDTKGSGDPKKRIRNEDAWGRNVRKRLRFKGEAYTSVRGKPVEAKLVKEVNCSKCKFKCTERITEDQRQSLNKYYWSLDTYKTKIEFLTKYVETYTPKRKMTGRRTFSRKYTFNIDGKEERVCKDFFKATLHISESTIATALEKSRKGPDAIVDMRGKHKPVNKTTEETLQSIRELIIYLTGMRPHRSSNNSRLGNEFKDINRLYQCYKYDCEKKNKKLASLGIFRNVLVKEFCIKTSKLKSDCEKNVSQQKNGQQANGETFSHQGLS